MLFVGDDWAEDHHDIEILDETGRRLVRRRLLEGATGIAVLHALIADHLDPDAEPDQVVVGIETDRGPWVQALLAGGYVVYAINPLQASRYRERHGSSGAKSDPGDAHVLAELVRLDRDHHRPITGDSSIAEHVKVVARAHQSMIWSRQRQTNTLRSMLREYYPGALAAFDDLAGRDALAVLALAPTPAQGRQLRVARVARRCAPLDGSATPTSLPRGSWRSYEPSSSRPTPGSSTPTRRARRRSSRSSVSSPASARSCEARWRRVLAGTRTLRSTAPNRDWEMCSAPGCSPSSATTPPLPRQPGPQELLRDGTGDPHLRQGPRRARPPRP